MRDFLGNSFSGNGYVSESVNFCKLYHFLEKKTKQQITTSTVSITGDELRSLGWMEKLFPKLKLTLTELEKEGVIEQVSYFLGGNVNFIVVREGEFLDYIYSKIGSIREKLLEISPQEKDEPLTRLLLSKEIQNLQEKLNLSPEWTNSTLGLIMMDIAIKRELKNMKGDGKISEVPRNGKERIKLFCDLYSLSSLTKDILCKFWDERGNLVHDPIHSFTKEEVDIIINVIGKIIEITEKGHK